MLTWLDKEEGERQVDGGGDDSAASPETVEFAGVVAGCQQEDVCRMFLATLQLVRLFPLPCSAMSILLSVT